LDRRTVVSLAIRGVDGLAEIERPVLQECWHFLVSLLGDMYWYTRTSSDRSRCRPSQVRYFFLPQVTDLNMDFDTEARLELNQIPGLPAFRNLCSLDLRNMVIGDLTMLYIAEVLFKSPNLKLLGLELKYDTEFLHGLVNNFRLLAEEDGTPGIRLKIQDLILGKGVSEQPYVAALPGHLYEFTDLSTLRSLKILNQRRPMDIHRPRVLLRYDLFLQATNLRFLSVHVFSRDIVALIDSLSCYGFLQEIQIRSIADYMNPSIDWYRPLVELGGGWRKILLGGDIFDVCPDHIYSDLFLEVFSQSYDVQELGLPYSRWVGFTRSTCTAIANARYRTCSNHN
jgi:hypothetical protein